MSRPDPFFHRKDVSKRFFAFDMFGTLVTNVKGTTLPIFEVFCGFYPGIRPEDLSRAYNRLVRDFQNTHRNREFPIDEIVRGIDNEFGCTHDPAAMEDPLLRDVRLYRAAEGAEDTLRYLKERGYRIGVLSNSRYHGCTISGILEDEGLLQYIDTVISSADIGIRKPDPASYQAILEALDADRKDCFFCGDNIAKDYNGPLAAGLRGAVLITKEGNRNATFSVKSIGELPGLFYARNP